jgi:hypothetical protein
MHKVCKRLDLVFMRKNEAHLGNPLPLDSLPETQQFVNKEKTEFLKPGNTCNSKKQAPYVGNNSSTSSQVYLLQSGGTVARSCSESIENQIFLWAMATSRKQMYGGRRGAKFESEQCECLKRFVALPPDVNISGVFNSSKRIKCDQKLTMTDDEVMDLMENPTKHMTVEIKGDLCLDKVHTPFHRCVDRSSRRECNKATNLAFDFFFTPGFLKTMRQRVQKNLYIARPQLMFRQGRLRVAFHVDKDAGSNVEYALGLIRSIKSQVHEADIIVFCDGESKIVDEYDYKQLANAGATLQVGVPTDIAWAHMVDAHIFVMSQSPFSSVPALLNEGIVVYPPQKQRMKPLKHWVLSKDLPLVMAQIGECGTLDRLPGLKDVEGPTAVPTVAPTNMPTVGAVRPTPVPTHVPTATMSYCCVCSDGSLKEAEVVILRKKGSKPHSHTSWLPDPSQYVHRCNNLAKIGCGMSVTIQGYGKCTGVAPTAVPTTAPTTGRPSVAPTAVPSTGTPTAIPTFVPTSPTMSPTATPSGVPTAIPTSKPSSDIAVTTDCCECDDGTLVSATIDDNLDASCPNQCSNLVQFKGDVVCEKHKAETKGTPRQIEKQLCVLLPCARGCPRSRAPSCNGSDGR